MESTEYREAIRRSKFWVVKIPGPETRRRMERQVIGERIKGFLAKQFPATKKTGIDESLLKTGLIDSLGILDVVAFLEKEFAIAITDEELLPENFESIRSIANFVQQKTIGE